MDRVTGRAPAVARDPGSKRARLWRRTRFGAALVVALVALLWSTSLPESSLPVVAVGAVLALLLAIEVAGMGKLVEWHLAVPLLVASGVAIGTVTFAVETEAPGPGIAWTALAALAATSAAVIVVLLGRPRRDAERRRRRLRWASGLAFWLLAPLPALALVREDFGHAGLVSLLVLSKVGDIAGYYGGSAFGRRHPFKRLSPGKTVEGCAASALAGLAVGAALSVAGALPGAWWQGLLAGLAINVAAQAGDLFESWVKRRTGVKDSGSWLGPSGGLLDVADSLLFTVPVALATWPLLLA